MRMTFLLTAALLAAPAMAQDNNAAAADANAATVAAPDANAADANTMNLDANAAVPLPPVMAEPVTTDTGAATPMPDEDKDFPWGIVGLVGLVGLLGRKRS